MTPGFNLFASSLRRRICVGFLCADGGADQATVAELATAKARVAELETRIAALESQAAVQSRTRGDMTDQLADLNMAQQVRTSWQLDAAVWSAGIPTAHATLPGPQYHLDWLMSVQIQKAEATHKLYRRWMSALLESAQELLASKDQVCCCQTWLLVPRKLLCASAKWSACHPHI